MKSIASNNKNKCDFFSVLMCRERGSKNSQRIWLLVFNGKFITTMISISVVSLVKIRCSIAQQCLWSFVHCRFAWIQILYTCFNASPVSLIYFSIKVRTHTERESLNGILNARCAMNIFKINGFHLKQRAAMTFKTIFEPFHLFSAQE